MRIAAIVWCAAIPGLQVYLFRRIYDDLIKNHMEGPKGFRAILAPWVEAGWCAIVESEIRFWNGAKIYLCHCANEKDIYKYQGAEIHVLIVDELTHFTEAMYRFLRNRVRMVGITVPAEYAGRFPRIVCGANPGNIGHLWVKTSFILGGEPMGIRQMPANEGGMRRQYIPARLEDNPSMADDDPGYEQRLEGLGSETLVRAMRWGDWDVIEGAFFQEFEQRRHVIAPFAIPPTWLRFRSADWGSAKPFSIGWWAVVGDDFRISSETMGIEAGQPGTGGIRHVLPRGSLVRYRELYGSSAPNVGLKLPAEDVADRIRALEAEDELIAYSVLDPAAFSSDGGPSIAERMASRKVFFQRADNARVSRKGAMGGWDQLRARLIGDGERPMIYFFSNCLDLIRTLPSLQHDASKPEDVDSDSEDHAPDETRYACMSRPYIKHIAAEEKAKRLVIGEGNEVSLDDLWDQKPKYGREKRI